MTYARLTRQVGNPHRSKFKDFLFFFFHFHFILYLQLSIHHFRHEMFSSFTHVKYHVNLFHLSLILRHITNIQPDTNLITCSWTLWKHTDQWWHHTTVMWAASCRRASRNPLTSNLSTQHSQSGVRKMCTQPHTVESGIVQSLKHAHSWKYC